MWMDQTYVRYFHDIEEATDWYFELDEADNSPDFLFQQMITIGLPEGELGPDGQCYKSEVLVSIFFENITTQQI
jgi:hypothetical protein